MLKIQGGQEMSVLKNYKVAGVAHYEKSILKFAKTNPVYSTNSKDIIAAKLWNTNVYQYCFSVLKTELIPEPSNPYDPNAIKVVVDGIHIGYIKAGSCKHVLKLIAENRIEKIDCTIKGGKFINVWGDGVHVQQVEKGESKYSIQLSITEA